MADEQRPTNLPETFYRTYDQETRDYWDEHLEYNTLRQNPKTGWGAERSSMLEAAGDVLRELTGPTGFTRTGGQETVYLNEKLKRLKREARTVGADYTARVMATSPDFGPAEGQEAQLEKIRADIARIKPKSEEADLAKMILDNIASGDPYGLLSVRIDQLHRLINEPRSTEQATVPEISSERLIELRQAADPPRLPEIIHEPETPRITPGRAFRGLGSLIGPGSKLKAVKRLFTLAQQGYQLLPEEYQLLGDVLDMEALTKPLPGTGVGLDYFRQMLGRVPPAPTSQEEREQPTGIATLEKSQEARRAYDEAMGITKNFKPTFEKLPGEWFLVEGQAEYAEGDIGEYNHEAIVRRNVLYKLADAANDFLDAGINLDDEYIDETTLEYIMAEQVEGAADPQLGADGQIATE